MKLYICWSTNGDDHDDCHKVHQALIDAGYTPCLGAALAQSTTG